MVNLQSGRTLMAWKAAPGIAVSPEYESRTWRSTATFDSTKRGNRRRDPVCDLDPARDRDHLPRRRRTSEKESQAMRWATTTTGRSAGQRDASPAAVAAAAGDAWWVVVTQ